MDLTALINSFFKTSFMYFGKEIAIPTNQLFRIVELINEETEDESEEETAQFDVEDRRTLDDVIKWLMQMDYVPSFCTACYRAGRVGDKFMEICKEKQIHNFCHPNALITLKEYLEDYASEDTKKIGYKLIEKELNELETTQVVKDKTKEYLEKIEHGQRDFRF